MTVDKKAREALDPGVSAHFNNSPAIPQVNMKEKARKRAADEKRQDRRTSWDIDPEIKAIIAKLAEEIDTSQSQVASYLIVAGLHAIKKGIILPPKDAAMDTNALKFSKNLQLPPFPK